MNVQRIVLAHGVPEWGEAARSCARLGARVSVTVSPTVAVIACANARSGERDDAAKGGVSAA